MEFDPLSDSSSTPSPAAENERATAERSTRDPLDLPLRSGDSEPPHQPAPRPPVGEGFAASVDGPARRAAGAAKASAAKVGAAKASGSAARAEDGGSGGAGGGSVGGGGADRRPPPGDDAESRTWKRLRLVLIYPLLAALLAAAAGVGVAASIRRPEVAEIDSFVPRLVTEVRDRNGEVTRTYSRENRILLRDGEVPAVLQNAIVATEDANFFQHGGVDLKGVARAMVTNLEAGRIKEGASTITMQLARELFSLTREQKWWRKVEEAFLSVELEKNYSKQQILTMYANLVNLGHGNYGMEAAARAYFNKSARDLDLAEAATLAGIPQRPSYFSVYRRPEAVVQRRNWVLQRMLDEGYATAAEVAAARQKPLLVTTRTQARELGPHFTEDVRRQLIDTYGATQLYDQGLQVDTTLDPVIQAAAEKALRDKLLELDHAKGWRGVEGQLDAEDLETVRLPSWGEVELAPDQWFEAVVLEADAESARIKYRDEIYTLGREGIRWTRQKRPDKLLTKGNVAWFRMVTPLDDEGEPIEGEAPYPVLEQEPELEGAVLVLESGRGAIRAMVGGFDYERNEFNRVTQAKRQVGSAFKPFVFGAALENGWTAADVIFDGPAVFTGATSQDVYSPRNYYRKYYGIVTLREALEKSVNVTSVKLLDLVGMDQVIDFARRCGIRSELPPYPSLALGSADMTPLELAAGYAAIVNNGLYVEPYTIERVVARDGRVLYDHLPRAHKAMEPQIAYVLTKMLQGVSLRGTGAGKLARQPIATGGKTGTTNDYTDAWFVGFTPRYTILTWVGYDQRRTIGRNMTGAEAALPIWTEVLENGLEQGWLEEGETFEPPPGIVTALIERHSGLLWGEGAERPIQEVFVEGTVPEKTYDAEAARIMALPWFLQEPFYLPKEGERMPAEIADWSLVRDVWAGRRRSSGP